MSRLGLRCSKSIGEFFERFFLDFFQFWGNTKKNNFGISKINNFWDSKLSIFKQKFFLQLFTPIFYTIFYTYFLTPIYFSIFTPISCYTKFFFTIFYTNFLYHFLHRFFYTNLFFNFQCSSRIFEMLKDLTLSSGYDTQLYGAHTEHAIKVLLLHLDDDESSVQNAVQTALESVQIIDPERVRKHAEIELKNHTNSKRITSLLNS